MTGHLPMKNYTDWERSEKQMESELLLKRSSRGCREVLLPWFHKHLPLWPPSLYLLAPITQHWPFHETLPQCPLVLLTIHGHPKWPQFFHVFKSTSMQMTPKSVPLCAVESHFHCLLDSLQRILWLSPLRASHPRSRGRLHWAKNPVQPPG